MPGDYAALNSHIDATPALSALRGEPLLAALNAPAGTVPDTMYQTGLLALLTTSLANVLNYANLGLIYADIDRNNVAGVQAWAAALAATSKITTGERDAILAYAGRTVAGGPSVAESIAGWGLTVTTHDLAAIGKDS